jgi:hypothetical protein
VNWQSLDYKGRLFPPSHSSNLLTMAGCAVGPDSNLLDASQIIWFDNSDDVVPILGPSLLKPSPLPRPASCSPSPIIAGSHRPHRVLRPSAKAWDPDNLESCSILAKRKPSTKQPVRHKVADSNGDSDKENTDPDDLVQTACSEYTCSKDVAKEDANKDNVATEIDDDSDQGNEGYLSTKKMGDEDRQVSLFPTMLSVVRLC